MAAKAGSGEPGAVAKSAGRALDVLEHIARSPTSSFVEMSNALNIPRTSLYHLLSLLLERGYLRQENRRGGYRVGPALDALARLGIAPQEFVNMVEPVITRLRREFDEDAALYLWRDDLVELAAVSTSSQRLRLAMQIGDMAPLYAIAPGWAILAEWPDEDIERFIKATEFKIFTARSVASGADLWKRIEAARVDGVAVSDGVFSAGVVGLGRVVYDGERIAGALSIAMPLARHTEEIEQRMRDRMLMVSASFPKRTAKNVAGTAAKAGA